MRYARLFAASCIGVALAWLASPNAHAATQCFTDQKVTAINIGYVDIWGMGPDGGDAVYFTLSNGRTYPLNYGFNLDWPRGRALHRVLRMAMDGGYRITGIDHFGWPCDDIDQINIRP